MASSSDPFQFQDFEEAGNLLGVSRDSTIIRIEDQFFSHENPRNASANGPEVDDVDSASDDKSELLGGQRKSAPFWTFEYYQRFFDIETHHVKERIIGSVLPWPGKNFIHVYLRKNPDLYGPFWICTTLVFAIAISGNLSNFLVHMGNPNYKYIPEFQKVTMAAAAIFSYAWLVPLTFWAFLLWRNIRIISFVSYSFMEIVCVYGYSLAIYIPAVVLWIIPFEWLRWCSITVALCLSGSVLVITFWPAIREDNPRIIVAVMFTIILLNILLAVGCKAYFFSKAERAVQAEKLASTDVIKATAA